MLHTTIISALNSEETSVAGYFTHCQLQPARIGASRLPVGNSLTPRGPCAVASICTWRSFDPCAPASDVVSSQAPEGTQAVVVTPSHRMSPLCAWAPSRAFMTDPSLSRSLQTRRTSAAVPESAGFGVPSARAEIEISDPCAYASRCRQNRLSCAALCKA